MKKTIVTLFILAVLIFHNGYSQTEVFFLGHQFGIGARAMSLGGAFLAISDDYSATYWNPAGLAQIRRMELWGAMSHFMMKDKTTYNNKSTNDETNATKLNSLGFAYPYPTYRGSFVLAVGYNRVRSFDAGLSFNEYFYQDNDIINHQYIEMENGNLSNYVFASAIDLTMNLSVGASINIWRGDDDYQQIIEYDSKAYGEDHYELYVNTDFSAINFKLGALYRMGILGRIAATISTPVKFNADVNWGTQESQSPDSLDTGTWDYKIKSPYIFGVGAAFTLFPNLIVAGDIEYSDWSQMKYLSEPFWGTQSEKNIEFKRNYRGTTQFRVGAEFTVPLLNLQLRGGFLNQPSPLKSVNSSTDRRYLTAGMGLFLDKQVKLDLAWLRGWWKNEIPRSSETLPIMEEVEINKLLVTLAYRF